MIPNTNLGRIVAVISGLIGIFIISLFIVTISQLVNLDDDERMAFNEIVVLGDTVEKRKKMENYMSKFILCKYKFLRKKNDLNTLLDRRKLELEKKNIFIDLKKKYTKNYNLQEFNKITMKHLDEKRKILFEKLENLEEIKENVILFLFSQMFY